MTASDPLPVDVVLEAVLTKLRSLAETSQTFGEPITVGDTTIVPYVSLRFGLGGGGGAGNGLHAEEDNAATMWGTAGGGVKIEPMGFLIVRGDRVDLMPIDRQTNPWSQLAEGVLPLLQQWVQSRKQADSDLTDS
ncbi:MAG: spore germination protein GerW family protein [Cyanobacteria bacterium P01_D01_bin.123]